MNSVTISVSTMRASFCMNNYKYLSNLNIYKKSMTSLVIIYKEPSIFNDLELSKFNLKLI